MDEYNLDRSFAGKQKSFSQWIRDSNPEKLPMKHLVSLWEGVLLRKNNPKYAERRENRRERYFFLKDAVDNGSLEPSSDIEKIDKDTLVNKNTFTKWLNTTNVSLIELPTIMHFWITNWEKPSKPVHASSHGDSHQKTDDFMTMREPKKKDDWFIIIRKRTIEMERKNKRTPNEHELWQSFCRPSPEFEEVSFDKRTRTLLLPGSRDLDREAFNKRYSRYYPKSGQ